MKNKRGIKGPRKVNTHAIIEKKTQKNKAPDSQTSQATCRTQVSHRPIKCQSRLLAQRGTKVNVSHRGDNPLLRPEGIQIATKSYTLQAMAPTNIKTVHETSLLHIESSLDQLGLLSPTHDQQRPQQQSGQITLQPVLINKSKFLL